MKYNNLPFSITNVCPKCEFSLSFNPPLNIFICHYCENFYRPQVLSKRRVSGPKRKLTIKR